MQVSLQLLAPKVFTLVVTGLDPGWDQKSGHSYQLGVTARLSGIEARMSGGPARVLVSTAT